MINEMLRLSKLFIGKARSHLFSRQCVSFARCQMEGAEIVPDVIKASPNDELTVVYSSHAIQFGEELTPTLVQNEPKVIWNGCDDYFYLLCMVDPDAPCRAEPQFRSWVHWLVGNIPGNEIAKGETIAEYVGSAPPEGSGLHRYVFLLFKQNGKIRFKEPHVSRNSALTRNNLNVQCFSEKYKLNVPIAGIYYYAQWDNHVPAVYQQLGLKLNV